MKFRDEEIMIKRVPHLKEKGVEGSAWSYTKVRDDMKFRRDEEMMIMPHLKKGVEGALGRRLST